MRFQVKIEQLNSILFFQRKISIIFKPFKCSFRSKVAPFCTGNRSFSNFNRTLETWSDEIEYSANAVYTGSAERCGNNNKIWFDKDTFLSLERCHYFIFNVLKGIKCIVAGVITFNQTYISWFKHFFKSGFFAMTCINRFR